MLQIPAVPFGPNHGFETIKWPQVSGCRHNLAASASGFGAECSVDYFKEKSIANQRSFHQQSLETNSRKTGGSRTGCRGTVGPECGTISWPLWIGTISWPLWPTYRFNFTHLGKLDWINCKGSHAPGFGVVKAAVI
jgi:hypothetical protein